MYNDYICADCGAKYLKDDSEIRISTFHNSECCECGKIKGVTHKRNYNYLKKTSRS